MRGKKKATRIIFICASSICDSEAKKLVCCAFTKGIGMHTSFCLFAGISGQPCQTGCHVPCDHFVHALFVSAEVIKRLEGDSSSLHGSIEHTWKARAPVRCLGTGEKNKTGKPVPQHGVLMSRNLEVGLRRSECMCTSVMKGSKVKLFGIYSHLCK